MKKLHLNSEAFSVGDFKQANGFACGGESKSFSMF
jgi:hypothetical protein